MDAETRTKVRELVALVLDAAKAMHRGRLHTGPIMTEWDFKAIAGVQAGRLSAVLALLDADSQEEMGEAFRVAELEDENTRLRTMVTGIRNAAAEAVEDFDNGDADEALEFLRGLAQRYPEATPAPNQEATEVERLRAQLQTEREYNQYLTRCFKAGGLTMPAPSQEAKP